MLLVYVPNTHLSERNYIIHTLLQNILGLNIQLVNEERKDILIKDNNTAKGRRLYIADIFFQTSKSKWLTLDSLPRQPLAIWDTLDIFREIPLIMPELPVIYGYEIGIGISSDKYLIKDQNEIHMGLDVFGSAFFMLTRYEELAKQDRDVHDRFPAVASLAHQEGFLERPIINEYIEILWWCLKKLWPQLKRKKRKFRTVLSHDVDVPFAQAFSGVQKLIRNCAGDILRRKSLGMTLQRIESWHGIKKGDFRQDLNYTFDHLMDISEQNGLQSAFYIKTACTNPLYDNSYPIDHPYVRQLLKDIYCRGHEIGLHPSYETYQNPEKTRDEFYKLLQICEEENIQQTFWGGRQHYLRWQVSTTWRNWAAAGLNYDSTVSYADYAGFRCGICYEFPAYDLEQRKLLPLVERPLIVMEDSVLGEQYMGLTGETALNFMLRLKDCCRTFNGDFTLLWHNSSFDTKQVKLMYRSIVEG